MDHPLDGCREKVDWAERELNALDEDVGQWMKDYPYTTTHHFYDEANVHVLWLSASRHPVEAWGVRIGNVVHSLRSALDHLVWQLVIFNGQRPKPGAGGNQFPIFTAKPRDGFVKRVKGSMLRGIATQDRAVIHQLQPYTRRSKVAIGRHPLTILADLSNQDKHQVILTTLWRMAPSTQFVGELVGIRDTGPPEEYESFALDRLYDGAIIAWAICPPRGPNPQVRVKGDFTAYVAFSDGRNVRDSLENIAQSVGAIVELFAARRFPR